MRLHQLEDFCRELYLQRENILMASEADLPVCTHDDGARAIGQVDRQDSAIVENNAPVGQCMRADRSHGDDRGRRVDDGATGRKVIGGRAGRGGKDDPVAKVFVHEISTAMDRYFCQSRALRPDNDIIER